MKKTILLIMATLLFVVSNLIAKDLTDDEIRQILIKQSLRSYS